MMINKKFVKLLALPDEDSYEEFEKLSHDEKKEFKKMLREDARKYQKLTLASETRARELEYELIKVTNEIKRIKSLH